MIKFTLNNLDSQVEWKKHLSILPLEKVDIYYTPLYYDIHEKNKEGTALCFVFKSQEELVLYPFLLNPVPGNLSSDNKQYFDIQGAYGYNGLLASTNDRGLLMEFHSIFSQYCHENNIIAEFTRFHSLLSNHLLSVDYMDVIFDRKTVVMDLTQPYEIIWNTQYSGNNRNMIRKAVKSGVTIRQSSAWEDYKAFFELYTRTMQHVSAEDYYFFDEKYFRNFFSNLSGHNTLFMATFDGKMIAAALFMFYGETLHYHLSARDPEFSKLAAGNLILDHAVKWGIGKGLKSFHLGGGSNSEENNSLFKFKANFSSDFKDFYIGKKVHNREIYDQVVSEWEIKNPGKKELYKNHLLKYRY